MNSQISVIIPTYNRGPCIKKTIDSVLDQTRLPLEILVVDDGSTDGTADWIEKHYNDAPLLHVVRQSNQGVASARNAGLSHVRGELIAFLDHDDWWLPHHLESLFQTILLHPSASVVFAKWRSVNVEGEELLNHLATANPTQLPSTGRAYRWVCSMPCPIVSMSASMMWTDSLRAIGGFDPAMAPADDWDLWLRLAQRSDFVQADQQEPSLLYVRHEHQQSQQFLRMRAAINRVAQKQKPLLWRYPDRALFLIALRDHLATVNLYHRAKQATEEGNFMSAWRYLLLAVSRAPSTLLSKQWLYLAGRMLRRDRRCY